MREPTVGIGSARQSNVRTNGAFPFFYHGRTTWPTIHHLTRNTNMKYRAAHFLIASLSIALLGACGGDDYPSPTEVVDPTPANEATVQATPAQRFTPGRVNLIAGGTVTFAFGSLEHQVFFDNAPAGAPDGIPEPTANKSVTRTFATRGTFDYNCHLHPGMRGTVVVE